MREEFKDSKIKGCFFHYIKAIWKKMKSYGLATKNLLDSMKIIVFGCKLFPFIRLNEKENFIVHLFNYAKSTS